MTVSEAVATRDRRKALTALADHLAGLLDDATPRDAAALAARLQSVLTDLDAQPSKGANPVDDLAARRADRRASASSS